MQTEAFWLTGIKYLTWTENQTQWFKGKNNVFDYKKAFLLFLSYFFGVENLDHIMSYNLYAK